MSEDDHQFHRQVHPSWLHQGRITSQVFTPTPKDNGLLSVYDGQQITANASFVHYTTVQRLNAFGTVSVTAGEIHSVGLPWRLDPEPFPEHAVIDFTGEPTPGKAKAKAHALAELARQRNWTYRP